jgi:hypothetical protein
LPVVLLGALEPLTDEIDIGLRRRCAVLRLLLEGVQHVDDTDERTV